MNSSNKSKKNTTKGSHLKSAKNASSSTSHLVERFENSNTLANDSPKTTPDVAASSLLGACSLNEQVQLDKSQPHVIVLKNAAEDKVADAALSNGQKHVSPSYASVLVADSKLQQKADKEALKQAAWLEISKKNRVIDGVTKLEEDRSGLSQFGVTLEADDLFDEDEEKRCLIGLFSGASPSKDQITSMVSHWKHYCQFHFHNSGWIVFEFEDEQAALDVLGAGPFYAANRPISMKQMPKLFNFSLSACSVAPVWVQLPNLPFRCWKKKSLNKICSYIGRPISTDQITNKKVTKSFARCLLDVDLSKVLPKVMKVTSLGLVFDQFILYEDLPTFCTKCCKIGHISEACISTSTDSCPPLYVPAPKSNVDFTTYTSKNAKKRQNKRAKKQAAGGKIEQAWKPVAKDKENEPVVSPKAKDVTAAPQESANETAANSDPESASLQAPNPKPLDAFEQAANAASAANSNDENAHAKPSNGSVKPDAATAKTTALKSDNVGNASDSGKLKTTANDSAAAISKGSNAKSKALNAPAKDAANKNNASQKSATANANVHLKSAKTNILSKEDLPPDSLVHGPNRYSLLANDNGPISDSQAPPVASSAGPPQGPACTTNEAHNTPVNGTPDSGAKDDSPATATETQAPIRYKNEEECLAAIKMLNGPNKFEPLVIWAEDHENEKFKALMKRLDPEARAYLPIYLAKEYGLLKPPYPDD